MREMETHDEKKYIIESFTGCSPPTVFREINVGDTQNCRINEETTNVY